MRAVHFSSAHSYNPAPSVHNSSLSLGHNFRLETHFSGPIDAESGMIANLRDIDAWLSEVIQDLDHRHLEVDVEYFKSHAPSPENIAIYCFDRIAEVLSLAKIENQKSRRADSSIQDLSSVNVVKVRLYESDNLWVDFPIT